MTRLERLLYRSYELLTKPVVTAPSSGSPSGVPEDPYGAVFDAVRVIREVDNLQDQHTRLINLMYGRVSQPELFEFVAGNLGIPYEASELLCLHWAEFPNLSEMKTLATMLGCSKSRISRVYRKVCIMLDEMQSDALHELNIYMRQRNWYNEIMYSTFISPK